jgi:hypothetical protein
MAQELNTKMVAKVPEGMVRGTDTVKVYWTAKAAKKKENGAGGHVKEGDEVEVHPLLAEKLIASGKATETAPAKKK